MIITLNQAGRRFNQDWIFRNINLKFTSPGKYAVLGPNGSGKSTLLNLLMGCLSPSEGDIKFEEGVAIPIDQVYKHISFAGPYLDLVEEFTLLETIDFHFKFKEFYPGVDSNAVLDILGLGASKDKALKYFSSGMKQRTKLALACCSNTSMLILDEPTSNLDRQGVSWYHELIKDFTNNRLVFVGSNQEEEYAFCHDFIQITDFK
ncbi:MAG: ATP-binding cassette domain-containing protein [Bacteroidota bacterium]